MGVVVDSNKWFECDAAEINALALPRTVCRVRGGWGQDYGWQAERRLSSSIGLNLTIIDKEVMDTAAGLVTVTRPPKQEGTTSEGARPAHHMNNTKSLFANPWPSYRYVCTLIASN
jgi:hypothetical protein